MGICYMPPPLPPVLSRKLQEKDLQNHAGPVASNPSSYLGCVQWVPPRVALLLPRFSIN